MTDEQLLKMINKINKKKTSFNKKLIVFIILFVIAFATAVLYVFLQVGSEPVVLVTAVMSFATVQLWNMASIKKTEVKEECKHDRLEEEAFK